MSQLKHFNGEIVRVFGSNGNLTTSLETLSRLSTSIDWSTQATTAAKVQLISSSALDTSTGTGARSVQVIGLDANYKLQSEIISLDGQAYVESLLSFIRVFQISTYLSGSTHSNAGDIYCIMTGTGGTPSGGVPPTLTSCWALMPIGWGVGTSGMYTVPAGEKVRLERFQVSSRSQEAGFYLFSQNSASTTENGMVLEGAISIGTSQAIEYSPPLPTSFVFDEKTDIYLKGLSVASGGIMTAVVFLRKIFKQRPSIY